MQRIPLPEQLALRSFTSDGAKGAGVTRSRIRAQDIANVSRGIFIPTGANISGTAALAAYTQTHPQAVLSHLSAARLWGIPLPPWAENDWRVHIAKPPSSGKPRRGNVVGHRLALREEEIVNLDGVRLTSPERTWLDLASLLAVPDLVAVGDHLVCEHGQLHPVPRSAICARNDLVRVMARHHGMRGMKAARMAYELVRVGADSPPETKLRLALIDAGLPEPELNHILFDLNGIPLVWPDAAYREYKISLQYDGLHHEDSEQYEKDIGRLEKTKGLGWEEIRFAKTDLNGERPPAVQKVQRALSDRGWRPTKSASRTYTSG